MVLDVKIRQDRNLISEVKSTLIVYIHVHMGGVRNQLFYTVSIYDKMVEKN